MFGKRRARQGEAQEFLRAAISYAGGDCLIWPFRRNRKGYAEVGHEGRVHLAHRVVCAAVHGEPTARSHAAHSCGNGHLGCVNPRHLRWATPTENESDKVAHGTTNRGERCWNVRLTEDDVRRIRTMKGTASQRQIAKLYGVGHVTVANILSGATWGWLR